jgi:formate hydrogenlyase subunit 4
MVLTAILIQLFQLLFALLGAPLLVGLIRALKARLQGRRGSPLLQPYRDLFKLLRKEAVVSVHASWITRVTPAILFVTTLAVLLIVPLVLAPMPLDSTADLLLLAYLLVVGTFFLALAGLDSASAFGGMGASREMTVAALAEPTIALAIFSLALSVGSTNLGEIVAHTLNAPALGFSPARVLAFIAMFIVMLAENGRLPVDNPTTHLELTMIHEAMILDYSGRYLALIEWASWMKLLTFFALLANLFVPWGVATTVTLPAILIAVMALVVKMAVLAAVVAVLETSVAKLRLFRVPELLSVSFVLAFLGVFAVTFLR